MCCKHVAPVGAHEIGMRVGQVVVVLTKHESGWWEGCLASGEGRTGWFPSNHLQMLPRAPRQKKLDSVCGASQGPSSAPTAEEFLPGLDYREASWADDSHDKRLDADKIDYKEASWAAFPRVLSEDEVRAYGASLAPPAAQHPSEDSDNTFDDDESVKHTLQIELDGVEADACERGAGSSGWLQQDLFLQASGPSDCGMLAMLNARGSGRGSGRGSCRSGRASGLGTELTAVEEDHSLSATHCNTSQHTATHCNTELMAVEEGLSNGVWRIQVSEVVGNPDDPHRCSADDGDAPKSGGRDFGYTMQSLRECSRSSIASLSSMQVSMSTVHVSFVPYAGVFPSPSLATFLLPYIRS